MAAEPIAETSCRRRAAHLIVMAAAAGCGSADEARSRRRIALLAGAVLRAGGGTLAAGAVRCVRRAARRSRSQSRSCLGWTSTYRDAAVLIPVVAREPSVTVLLTVRTPHLSAHAGQIAFPGGKIDPADATPGGRGASRDARRRSASIRRQSSRSAALAPYLSRTGYRIFPVLARVDPAFGLTLNPEEVEDVFEVPLAFLMNPENHRQASRTFRASSGLLRNTLRGALYMGCHRGNHPRPLRADI